jgi:hypothetical protein
MTPTEILARAAEVESPALHALVIGHLQAGRQDMAEAALWLPPDALAVLDAWLTAEMASAGYAGALAALMAGGDTGNRPSPPGTDRAATRDT